jgi:hypothetical protein
MGAPSSNLLKCPKCATGKLAKLPSGYTCDSCGFEPFKRSPQEREPPPAPIVTRREEDRPFTPADLAVNQPKRVLFTAFDKRPDQMRLAWVAAGGGLRYAHMVPLQTLPPGESVPIRVIAYNQSLGPIGIELLLHLTGNNGAAVDGRTYAGDLPPDHVLEATFQLPPPAQAEECRVSVAGRAVPPTGRPQHPMTTPPVEPLPSGSGIAPTQTDPVVRFMTSCRCPRCENVMVWMPGSARRVRSWCCDACGHRVDSGMLV